MGTPQQSLNKGDLPTYRDIARFFLPLSATNLMLMLSHSIVHAGVARTAQPETSLAAYALARSLVRMIENPVFMVRQTVASLVEDMDSYRKVRRFVYAITILVMGVLGLLGFTQAGYFVFHNIMGASSDVAQQSHLAMTVLLFLPLAAVTRNLYHGVAILSRQTMMVPKSSLLRLILVCVIIFGLALYTSLPGALSASLAFVGAFSVEALLMRWRAKPLLADPVIFSKGAKGTLDYRSIALFFLPLVVTTAVATAFGPVINSGLNRTADPTLAVAAFAVGNSLGQMFVAPMNMLHQCTLAFTRVGEPQTYQVVRRFILFFSAMATVVLAMISFSPVGLILLERLIGVSGETAISSVRVMQVKCLMPIVLGWREYLWGIFLQQRMTGLIGRGKALHLGVLAAVLIVFLGTGIGDAAAIGALSMVVGEFAECLYMQHCYNRMNIMGNESKVLSR